MNTKEILCKAECLLSDKERWTAGSNAKNIYEKEVIYSSQDAWKFDAEGAILSISNFHDGCEAFNYLNNIGNILYGEYLLDINDERGYKAVMLCFKEAIESL